MVRSVHNWLLPVLLLPLLTGFLQAQDDIWVFEGLITKADPKLAPDLQSGWVLSGSFTFTALDLEEEFLSDDQHSGRFSGGISEAELTIDLYHQMLFEATQVPGMAGVDYTDNDPENDGRDLYGWFFPMKGDLGQSGWSSRWLQIWLSDSEGRMIQSVPPAISPYGLKPEAAWFRLTMVNDKRETVFVDGTIEYFGPLSGLDEMGVAESWRGVAADLSAQLVERDATIASLREELAAAIARVNSLRQMVDLMVEERNRLEAETRLLEEQARKTDPDIEEAMSALQADKALLQDEIEALNERNQSLAESLAESDFQRRQLQKELEVAELALTTGDEEIREPVVSTVPVTSTDGKEIGVMTIIEEPMVIEKPVPVYIEVPAQITAGQREGPPATSGEAQRPRRTGPRKFR